MRFIEILFLFYYLQMFLPFINGVSCYPSCVADEKGNVVAVTHVDTAKDLEDFFRTECIRMGYESMSIIALYYLNNNLIKSTILCKEPFLILLSNVVHLVQVSPYQYL